LVLHSAVLDFVLDCTVAKLGVYENNDTSGQDEMEEYIGGSLRNVSMIRRYAW